MPNNGGVIQCCRNEATLIVKNSKFVNNHALNGGAIYVMNTNSLLIVDNCTFENNRAQGYKTSCGGAISAHRGNISHSKFINNYAPAKGGAIYFQNDGILHNSTFKNNHVDDEGGAIYCSGNLIGDNSTFEIIVPSIAVPFIVSMQHLHFLNFITIPECMMVVLFGF